MTFRPRSRSVNGVSRIRRDTYGKDWYTTVNEVQKRDGMQCMHPGCKAMVSLHTHHARALTRGGTTSKANLITLCEEHHEARHKHMSHNRSPTPKGYTPGGALNLPKLSDLNKRRKR